MVAVSRPRAPKSAEDMTVQPPPTGIRSSRSEKTSESIKTNASVQLESPSQEPFHYVTLCTKKPDQPAFFLITKTTGTNGESETWTSTSLPLYPSERVAPVSTTLVAAELERATPLSALPGLATLGPATPGPATSVAATPGPATLVAATPGPAATPLRPSQRCPEQGILTFKPLPLRDANGHLKKIKRPSEFPAPVLPKKRPWNGQPVKKAKKARQGPAIGRSPLFAVNVRRTARKMRFKLIAKKK